MSDFPNKKTLEDFNLSFQPSIDKRQIDVLATMRFLENGESVVFLGPPCVNKTPSCFSPWSCGCKTPVPLPITSTATNSMNISKKPILRTGYRTYSRSCRSTGCLSLTISDISLWTFREPTCFSSSSQGGMRRHPRSSPLTKLFPNGIKYLPMSQSPPPFWTLFLHHCTVVNIKGDPTG